MRTSRLASAAAALALTGAPLRAMPQIEITGIGSPEFAGIDGLVANYMAANGIPAGVVGIIKDGAILYQRGFNTPENTTLRIASVEKPFTAAAIRILAEQEPNVLDLDDYVFDLGQAEGGILDIAPWGGAAAADVDEIRVQHLLDHEGGWDRDVAGDPMLMSIEIAEAMDVSSPPTRLQTASYWMSQPLQFEPGHGEAYSNFGYMLLGLIVLELSGMEPVSFVRSFTVTKDDWVPSTEIIWGRTLKPDRYFRERGYKWVHECDNVFDPDGPPVPCPDGGFYLEGMAGHGNLVMSTTPILRFLDRYDVAGDDIGAPHGGSPPSVGHTGTLPGTSTAATQRSDGVHVVVLYNHRSETIEYAANTVTQIYNQLDASFAAWPTFEVDGFWVDFDAEPSYWGAFDTPFNSMDDALAYTADGTKLRFKPGSSGSWSGVISEKMRLDAPFGTAVIGR